MEKQFRQGRLRRMTKFAISELSAVDFPAQEGATAVLMKRREKQLVLEVPDDLSTEDRAELVDLAERIGQSKNGVGMDLLQRLLVARMRALGVTVRDLARETRPNEDTAVAKHADPRARLGRLLGSGDGGDPWPA